MKSTCRGWEPNLYSLYASARRGASIQLSEVNLVRDVPPFIQDRGAAGSRTDAQLGSRRGRHEAGVSLGEVAAKSTEWLIC
jgi:hypothetical protein